MQSHLARLGSVAAIGGALLLMFTTFLHPIGADPNDAEAAFAEYAADSLWRDAKNLRSGSAGRVAWTATHTPCPHRAASPENRTVPPTGLSVRRPENSRC